MNSYEHGLKNEEIESYRLRTHYLAKVEKKLMSKIAALQKLTLARKKLYGENMNA